MARLSDMRLPIRTRGDFTVGGNLGVGDPAFVMSRVFERSVRPNETDNIRPAYRVGDIVIYHNADTGTEIYRARAGDANILHWELVNDLPIHIASEDPTAETSVPEGAFPVGRRWLNSSTKTLWVRSAFTGDDGEDADWIEEGALYDNLSITGDLTVGGNIALRGRNITPIYTDTRAPTLTDDSRLNFKVGDLWLDNSTDYIYRATSVANGQAVWDIVRPVTRTEQLFQQRVASGTRTLDTGKTFSGGDSEIGNDTKFLLFRATNYLTGTSTRANIASNTGVIVLSEFVAGAEVVIGDTEGNSERAVGITYTNDRTFTVRQIAAGGATHAMELSAIHAVR